MNQRILFFIVFIFGICIGEMLMAKEFHYPGEELNGTWQVIKHDYRGVTDIDSPQIKDFFDSSNDSVNSMFLLPDGQKIGFWMTGESHIINPLERPRSGMDIGMKLVFPLNKSLCKPGAWDYLCDKNGNFDLNNIDIKKNIKDNSYIVAEPDGGMLNHDFLTAQAFAYLKSLWPNLKNYYYIVNINDGLNYFNIYPVKNNEEIMILAGGTGKAWFGMLLKRVK